jgi:UDP-N-acetylmuramoylalanine--D-glutamate ligase
MPTKELLLTDLWNKSMLILGFGVEGRSTYDFLRPLYPGHTIGVADQTSFDALDPEIQTKLISDRYARLHFGQDYMSSLIEYDIVFKAPGISYAHPVLQEALNTGRTITSHTELFFANCPGRIVGVTGTKGKGTTSKLIHSILAAEGLDAKFVGNVGVPPLPLLKTAKKSTIFVFELSAQQLERISRSPSIAVLLDIVPDHLDHFENFDAYCEAKSNITRYQSGTDYLIYNAHFPTPRKLATATAANTVPYSVEVLEGHGCYIEDGHIIYCSEAGLREAVTTVQEVQKSIPDSFNLHNVLPAVAVAKVLGIGSQKIIEGIRRFEPLPNRFDALGTYRGITFYRGSLSTVPEVAIGHLKSLGDDVQTVLLGGFDRGLDFSALGDYLVTSQVRNVILFPKTGRRIWQSVSDAAKRKGQAIAIEAFFIQNNEGPEKAMKDAVLLAYKHTDRGKTCLLSPASAAYGVFKDSIERGDLFKRFVEELGMSDL